jgi:hypothetical protein
MPKLLLFAPCERVILARDNTASLITLLDAININIGPKAEIKEDVLLPFVWHAFILWQREGPEDDLPRRQKVELSFLGSKASATVEGPFEFISGKEKLRCILRIPGLPLPESSGKAMLKLSTRPEGSDGAWTEIATYPINVERQSSA